MKDSTQEWSAAFSGRHCGDATVGTAPYLGVFPFYSVFLCVAAGGSAEITTETPQTPPLAAPRADAAPTHPRPNFIGAVRGVQGAVRCAVCPNIRRAAESTGVQSLADVRTPEQPETGQNGRRDVGAQEKGNRENGRHPHAAQHQHTAHDTHTLTSKMPLMKYKRPLDLEHAMATETTPIQKGLWGRFSETASS